jgi:hypothetical protein
MDILVCVTGSAVGAEREYSNWPKRHSTTVICIKKDGEVSTKYS